MISPHRLFTLFKYSVYALVTLNVYLFFAEEWAASLLQYPGGVPAGSLIEAYAATIDTAAWLVLILMFELETSLLSPAHFTRPVVWSLHLLRVFSYCFIVYAFYGYIVNVMVVSQVDVAAGISSLCDVVAGNWSYAVILDQYELITSENCASFSDANRYYQYSGMQVLVDETGYRDILRLAWVDVINSGVWLLVVLNLEVDVRLQEHGKLDGLVLRISNISKFFIYAVLFLAAVYWGIKGDFLDFWDAFLWLLAFVLIELNVFNWRKESRHELEIATLGDSGQRQPG
ncbi:MAG TPA: hypothetical protein VLB07_06970 [Woeseiaceae bacterium]|nr:hypothetical protein [Woeseiaceae bacterium]